MKKQFLRYVIEFVVTFVFIIIGILAALGVVTLFGITGQIGYFIAIVVCGVMNAAAGFILGCFLSTLFFE